MFKDIDNKHKMEEKVYNKRANTMERCHSADEISTSNCVAYTLTASVPAVNIDDPQAVFYEDVPL